ncbi:response regulator [Polaribacter glomeratus]|uniref:response regulator n=1 Tax=Polaribacter glomeratus TaxID=102 RepID=UPI000CF37B1D|nr:response regulator [Polaribacter glomeratus]TXD67212.1 response regulator [Polaribacter glomeratus]
MNISTCKFLGNNTRASNKLSFILNDVLGSLKTKADRLSFKEKSLESNSTKKDILSTAQQNNEKKEVKDSIKKDTTTKASINSLKSKKVLVVDDNIMNRMLANVILKEFEVHVSEANDGEEAVNYLQNNSCDLVLMDLQMPVLNGYEASEIIRQKLKLDIPIIALTASDIEEEKQKCFEVGMNDYLFKPFNREQFIEIICKWITK